MESLRAQIRDAWIKRLEDDPTVDRRLLERLKKAVSTDGLLSRAALATLVEQSRVIE